MPGLTNSVAGITYATIQNAGSPYQGLAIPMTQIAGPQEKRLRFRGFEYLTSPQAYAGYHES